MSKCFIPNVLIRRKSNEVSVIVYLSKGSFVFKDNFTKDINNKLSSLLLKKFGSVLLFIRFIEVTGTKFSAALVANFMKKQLERRVPFRKVLRTSISKVKELGASLGGVKLQISGRLNGAEIARTEWVREGRVPLHTLRAKIDYANLEALEYFY